ncbi:hypothetical protein BGW37DRAFT_425618, partial [Umbelopsis sp. PMI_123]
PIFAKLIAGCLRLNNISKAWDIFDEMQLKYHKPDEVTYSLMIHACAKQMQEVHGFEPDRITYNTLMHGCAKNKDLTRARDIYRLMLKKAREPDTQHQMAPDDRTYSSLLWTYANYRPPKRNADFRVVNEELQNSLVPTDGTPLSPQLPANRKELLSEVQAIFSYAQENTNISSSVLNAYLGVHIAHHKADEVVNIYQDMFDKFNITHNGYTFKHVLDHCYRTKNIEFAYKVWDDREEWLDGMRQQYHLDENDSQAVMRKKQTNLASSQAELGWTMADQKAAILLMANTLSRYFEVNFYG